ncbi:hypothetical protein ACH5RR_028908 [Cinchona calisaya]|uniref:Uncharacterized protein n=1 Tax=Cinchona calisaya TaxID=153742 RepID=A0ABD2YUL0_9GENT
MGSLLRNGKALNSNTRGIPVTKNKGSLTSSSKFQLGMRNNTRNTTPVKLSTQLGFNCGMDHHREVIALRRENYKRKINLQLGRGLRDVERTYPVIMSSNNLVDRATNSSQEPRNKECTQKSHCYIR